MNSSLLQRLMPEDIRWLFKHGEQQMLQANTVIQTRDNSSSEHTSQSHLFKLKFHLILEGSLSLTLPPSRPNGATSQWPELLRLQAGDAWGTVPFVSLFLPAGEVTVLNPTLILSLETTELEKKLLSDEAFAARFYRFLAQLLSQRLAYLAQACGYSLALLKQLQLKQASTLFAALEDHDLDWLMAVGQVQDFSAGDRITQLYQPLETLHIILEGSLSLMAPEKALPPIYAAFLPTEQLPREIEFARLSQGELLGEQFLVDPLPPAYGARALRSSRLLSIPRWRLEAKLLYDARFAARLYRVLAIVLASKQQNLVSNIGFQLPMQELDEQLLQQVNLAESRFEWLSQRLRTDATPLPSAAMTAIA